MLLYVIWLQDQVQRYCLLRVQQILEAEIRYSGISLDEWILVKAQGRLGRADDGFSRLFGIIDDIGSTFGHFRMDEQLIEYMLLIHRQNAVNLGFVTAHHDVRSLPIHYIFVSDDCLAKVFECDTGFFLRVAFLDIQDGSSFLLGKLQCFDKRLQVRYIRAIDLFQMGMGLPSLSFL